MKNLPGILKEITQLTNTIESNYPWLYRTLDENPMTIPATDHPQIDKKIMQEYLESLTQLLKHHTESPKNK
jgi:hypothetical protein